MPWCQAGIAPRSGRTGRPACSHRRRPGLQAARRMHPTPICCDGRRGRHQVGDGEARAVAVPLSSKAKLTADIRAPPATPRAPGSRARRTPSARTAVAPRHGPRRSAHNWRAPGLQGGHRGRGHCCDCTNSRLVNWAARGLSQVKGAAVSQSQRNEQVKPRARAASRLPCFRRLRRHICRRCRLLLSLQPWL